VAAFGEELEALVALARGPEQARQKAHRRALALQCEMRALDCAVRRSGPEQIVLQVRVRMHTSCIYVLARAAPRCGCRPGSCARPGPSVPRISLFQLHPHTFVSRFVPTLMLVRAPARPRSCPSLSVQRLLRSVEKLLKDLGAGPITSSSAALGPSGGRSSALDRIGGGVGSASGQRGDLSSLFSESGTGGRAAWETEVQQSLIHAQVDRDLDFRESNVAQRAQELAKVRECAGMYAEGRGKCRV
jgi:hypothetical protein